MFENVFYYSSSLFARILNFPSNILSILALLLSYVNYSLLKSVENNTLRSNLIDKSYDVFNELGILRLENPLFSHLLETAENYYNISRAINQISRSSDKEILLEQFLKERALAMLIFNSFESTFYKYHNLKKGDNIRKGFLLDVLNFFTDVLLRNPRLIFFWNEKGERLCMLFEKDTREYYDKKVTYYYVSHGIDITSKMDIKGPFYRE